MGKLWIIFFRFLSHWRLLTSIVSAFEAVGSSFIDCLFPWLWNYKGAQVKGGRSTWEKEQSRMQKIRHEIKKGNENDLTISARQEFYRLWVCVFIFGLLNKKKTFMETFSLTKGLLRPGSGAWNLNAQRRDLVENTNESPALEMMGILIPYVWGKKDISCLERIYISYRWRGAGQGEAGACVW